MKAILLTILFFCSTFFVQCQKQKNVLFIISDDLRTDLNCYGNELIKSPNIDKLASEGMLFKRAYVQQAVCSASRASFLTGTRPNTTGVDYPYSEYFVNDFLPNHPSIGQFFHNNGYYAQNFGKIHHGNSYDTLSAPHFNPLNQIPYKLRKYVKKTNVKILKKMGKKGVPPFEAANVEDNVYEDGRTADEVIKVLKKMKGTKQPFFLSVGFYKPHLPFNAPKKYWDLYDPKEIKLALNKTHPKDSPKLSTTNYSLGPYKGEKPDYNKILRDSTAINLKHAYYACVSFMDAQVGRIVKELEELGLKDDTVIVFISDHGWHLGEQGMWGKTTNFENATRAPMIISVPGMKNKGHVSKKLVEYVDVFPTILEASDMAACMPKYLEGTSIVPLLKEPNRNWKRAAFSQFPRGNIATIEGYSVRTENYRYTEWWDNEEDKLLATELYDHQIDSLESINVFSDKKYKNHISDLHKILAEGWKNSLPKGMTTEANNPYAPRSISTEGEGSKRKKAWNNYLKMKKELGEKPKLIFKRY